MMVEQMGMSDVIGPRNIQTQQSMFAAPDGGLTIKNKADAEVDRILAEQYARGMKLLTDNKDLLDAIAKTLIEKEKIFGTEMLKLIHSILLKQFSCMIKEVVMGRSHHEMKSQPLQQSNLLVGLSS